MVIQRNVRKSRSWLQNTGDPIYRALKGTDIKNKRGMHFIEVNIKLWRDLKYLKERYRFDLASHIKRKLPKKGKLNVLDSGSGFMGVSADLKNQPFGSKIFVTALNVVHPSFFKQNEKRILKQIATAQKKKHRAEQQKLEKFLKRLRTAVENSKIVDRCRVSPIETFSTKKRFHVMLDFYGSLEYSYYFSRVLQQYFSLLKPNGSVFIAGPISVLKCKAVLLSEFGRNGSFTKNKKHFFQIEQVNNTEIYEMKKLPKNK